MFTTEPPLLQRVERLIDQAPRVDPHTHLRCDRLGAPDLASLLSYHWVQTELRAVGLPAEDADPSLPGDERVRRMLPFLARMRNTATSWTLHRIFRDLYDVSDPVLTEAVARDLGDRIAATGADPAWGPSVLRDRMNIRTFVTSLGNRSSGPDGDPDNALFMLDAHYLFCPGVATDLEPFFDGLTTKAPYYEALCSLGDGERPTSPGRLERLLHGWLDRTLSDRVRFTNTFLPIEQRFAPPDDARTRRALEAGAAGRPLEDADVDALVRAVTWSALGWHHERRKAVQVAVGAEYFICDGKSIPRFQEAWIGDFARTAHHFGGARFDLMMASDVLTQEVAVLARQFPNVYASGYWWHNFVPSQVERIVALRMQVAPMTKWSGYLSDAYSVEWAYGKLQLVKRAMAASLARLVESGFLEEDALPEVLAQVLHDTPVALYDLGPRSG